MTGSGLSGQTGAHDDPRYRQGMADLQGGRWQDAIDAFQSLQGDFPADERAAEALAEARFKANLDAGGRVRGRRWAIPWRPLITGILIIVVTIAVGALVRGLVVQQLLPSLAEAREERVRSQLLAEGRAYLEAGELAAAHARFSALLDRVPAHPEALRALEQIAAQRHIEDLYRQAVAFHEQGDHARAQKLYAEILELDPGYRDVEERLRGIRRAQEIHELFAQAQEAYDAGQAREALSLYQQVREMNVSYERELIDERLFKLYMRIGREIVDSRQEDQLQRAVSYFARSLSLRPASPDAAGEHRLAITCSEGLSAFSNQSWGSAIARLRTVFDERSEYLGGIVAERLYLAHVRLGEQYEQAGNLQLAYEQYERAQELPVDTALASSLAANVAPLLTPTPRPTPVPTSPAEPTRPPFVGREVQDENLLTNASFEGAWYDIYTGQVPEGWRIYWLDGVEFPGSADVALAPETVVGQRARTPPEERDLLFRDGSRHLKVFKGFAPMYAAVVQDVEGLDVGRRYRLTAPIFVDTYIWDGGKVAPGPDSARVRLGAAPPGAVWRDEGAINYSEWWDGHNTSNFFFRYSDYTFEFEATESEMTIYIELAAIWGLNNNGFFLDDVALNPLGSR